MEIIADLHIHSRYSMATSKLGTPEYLDLWARKKGISLVGTGDFTHPAWREELKEKLGMAIIFITHDFTNLCGNIISFFTNHRR